MTTEVEDPRQVWYQGGQRNKTFLRTRVRNPECPPGTDIISGSDTLEVISDLQKQSVWNGRDKSQTEVVEKKIRKKESRCNK